MSPTPVAGRPSSVSVIKWDTQALRGRDALVFQNVTAHEGGQWRKVRSVMIDIDSSDDLIDDLIETLEKHRWRRRGAGLEQSVNKLGSALAAAEKDLVQHRDETIRLSDYVAVLTKDLEAAKEELRLFRTT